MSVFHNNALIGAGGGAAAAAVAANITKSLRFNSADSADLRRTPSSSSNRRTFTISFWVKRSKLGANQRVLSTATNDFIRFESNDTFLVFETFARLRTEQVFRDLSSWYHFVVAVDTTQSTASNRVKFYVNGAQITDFSTETYPSQNADSPINFTTQHQIGSGTVEYFDGYLADFYLIDGSQLSATSFGAYDDNGVWQAIGYSGTFGTNGFHLLDFANESTVGHDSSGNNNDFTANNISTSAGAGNDVLFDVPVNGDQSDTGAGGEVSANYPTLSPIDNLDSGVTLSNGNLRAAVGSGTSSKNPRSTIFLNSGKWYWEMTVSAKSTFLMAGIATSSVGKSGAALNQTGGYGYGSGGNYYAGSGSVSDSSPAAFTTNDVNCEMGC